jgi:hypothetical protein
MQDRLLATCERGVFNAIASSKSPSGRALGRFLPETCPASSFGVAASFLPLAIVSADSVTVCNTS